MDEKVKKSLTDLIDETLMELEELKKSRFSASEVELKGPGEGIAGKPSNGDLHAKAEDKKDEDKDEDKDDKDDKDMDKGEGENRQSDPNGGHHKAAAGDGDKHGQAPGRAPKDHKHVGNGKNNEADPDGGSHRPADEAAAKADMDKKEKEDKDKKDKEDKDKKDMDKNDKTGMPEGTAKKSDEEMSSLMKSMIDDRVKPIEDKLGTILALVNKIADQPVAPKGITSKAVPLFKNDDEGVKPLNKSDVSSKLFELKKSGTKVESLDVTRAELGQDLEFIAKKYNLSK